MKKMNKILIGIFAFTILFTLFNVNAVMAAGESSIEVNGDTYQYQIQANNSVMFTFRLGTRLTFRSNVNIDARLDCEALKIGEKYFKIDIEADHDLQMNMTCTEEQIQLGLMMGNTYRIRNRHRYLYQEGFCAFIQCNGSCQAKLKIQANNRNRIGTWAYYDEPSEEWVSVPTTIEDGYLVAETDHFSYWTVLIPQSVNNTMLYVSIIAIIGVIALVSVFLIRRRN